MKRFALILSIITAFALTAPAVGVTAVGDSNSTIQTVSASKALRSDYDRVKRTSRTEARKRLGAQEYERARVARIQKIRAAKAAREKAARIRAARLAAARAEARKVSAANKRVSVQKSATRGTVSHSAPGGVAACIRKYESGGNYRAENPSSTASGAYQFLDSTWHAITGRSDRAKDAPPSVQDAAFFKLWAGGANASQWTTAHLCGY